MFSCKFCGIFKDTFFIELFRATTSDSTKKKKNDKNDKKCSDIVIKTSKWYQLQSYLWLYVNFENGFGCWENFENNLQKKFQKSQKFARKIPVAEFRYSQSIFLRFTVTLFHSNLDEKITSNEQKVTSHE